jgi:hypothetical protein
MQSLPRAQLAITQSSGNKKKKSYTPLRANTTSRADSPEAVLFIMPVTRALSSGAASAQDMSPIPTATPGGG